MAAFIISESNANSTHQHSPSRSRRDKRRRTKKSDVLDSWVVFEHLHTARRKEVRDYLIQNLYHMSNDDFDFFLPQLCTLCMTRSKDLSRDLEIFILFKSMNSIHFALKSFWILHALEYYAVVSKHRHRCQEVRQNIEMVVVNGRLPPHLEKYRHKQQKRLHQRNGVHSQPPTPGRSARNKSSKSTSSNTLSSSPARTQDAAEPASNAVPVAVVPARPPSPRLEAQSAPVSSDGSAQSGEERDRGVVFSTFVVSDKHREIDGDASLHPGVVLSPEPVLNGESRHGVVDEDTDVAPDPSVDDVKREDEEDARRRARADHSVYLKKQRRCSFFNAQIDFAHFLEGVATVLEQEENDQRENLLRRNLDYANDCLPTGLYLPIGVASSRHKSIIRMLPNECICLSSKEKVPYMLFVEVNRCDFPVSASNITHIMRDSAVTSSGLYVLIDEEEQSRPDDDSKLAELQEEEVSRRKHRGSSAVLSTITPITPLTSPLRRSNSRSPKRVRGKRSPNRRTASDDSPSSRPSLRRERRASLPISAVPAPVPKRPNRAREKEMRKQMEALVPHEPRSHRAREEHHDSGASSMRWKTPPFGELWKDRRDRLREMQESLYPQLKKCRTWDIQAAIFKSGEDMRQEQLAMQFIMLFEKIFREAKLPLQLRPYSVVCTSPASGFVEVLTNAVSISSLKKRIENFSSLRLFYEQYFGSNFEKAQNNFVESMAAYSLVSYFLQVKDRHNGNLMIDSDGRIIHIDFGFILSNSPGGNMGFENAPFKLTEELIEIMGGETSEKFGYFQLLVMRGFLEARKHYRHFCLLADIMIEGSPMPCFCAGHNAIEQLKQRFVPHLSHEECIEHVMALIEQSVCNWRTVQYDNLQRITNGIM